jgi:hypothetical protein
MGKKRERGSCTFVKPDGTLCKAFAIKGTKFCYFHSVAITEQGRKASSEGGKKGGGRPKDPLPPSARLYRFEKIQHVVELLQETANRMLAGCDGAIDHKMGTALAVVGGQILKALGTMKLEELAEKIHRLEEQQAQQAAKRLTLGNAGEQIPFEPVLFTVPRDDQMEPFDEHDDAAGLTPPVREVEDFVAGFAREPDPGPDPGQPGADIFAGGYDAGPVTGEADDDELYADDPPLLSPSGQRVFR